MSASVKIRTAQERNREVGQDDQVRQH